MLVMKFGGTSVGSPDSIRAVSKLVKKAAAKEEQVVVCVSAHSGVTNMLVSAAHAALKGDSLTGLTALQSRHQEIVEGLGLDMALIQDDLRDLGVLLGGIAMLRELSLRTMDLVYSFGERMSSKVVAAAMRQEDEVDAVAVPSYDIGMITTDRHGEAKPLPDIYERIPLALESYHGKVVITTGFIGKTESGDITTFGRGGSDYSAALFGAALKAREIQIWTDVDGVMSANPKLIPEAQPVETMTFAEASEIAYYGGKVLHPATMVPAVKCDIPIRVLNTHNPDHPGTVIVSDIAGERPTVKSISYKEDITLIDVISSRMLMQHGFMAWLFNIFAKHEVVIGMISTSEVTVSMTTDQPQNLKKAAQEMENSDFVDDVVVEHGKAIVSIVGSGMRYHRGLAARTFQAVADAGVNIQLISQGASEINIVILVNNEDVKPTVQALHDLFFKEGAGQAE